MAVPPTSAAVAVPAAARGFALAVLVAVSVPGAVVWGQNLDWAASHAELPPMTPEDCEELILTGFRPVVNWLERAGIKRLYGLPYDDNTMVYQRFIEMLYPIELVNVPESELPDGALVLFTTEKALTLPHRVEFRAIKQTPSGGREWVVLGRVKR